VLVGCWLRRRLVGARLDRVWRGGMFLSRTFWLFGVGSFFVSWGCCTGYMYNGGNGREEFLMRGQVL
jgi:hypothetical protein